MPVLVRRIVQLVAPSCFVHCPKPIRVRRDRFIRRREELERSIMLARGNAGDHGAILVVLDSDGDCPARLGPDLLSRVRPVAAGVEIGVVVAHREFEAWFLAAAESVRGRRGLSSTLASPADPEAVADAKGVLRRHMPPGRRYSETTDQPALAELFDLQAARRAPSFDKCYREVERLVRSLCGMNEQTVPSTAH